ncbi:MAG: hypothetical protein K1X57_03845 [Gemmataceae bacterium]|nr:hypothetical protein [Gemmataceae bacterium]
MTAQLGEPCIDVTALATRTHAELREFAPAPRYVPTELAIAVGLNGRTRLHAQAIGLGLDDLTAECRLVTIRGLTATIFNCLIVPDLPGRTPLFVADMLASHDELRIGFFDVQVPGVSDALRECVAAETWKLVGRYAHLPADDPPTWAVAHSTGAYLCCRPEGAEQAAELLEAYWDYLSLWIQMARHPSAAETAPPEGAARALAAMFEEHLSSAPNRPYLERQFGTHWAHRFCNEFLYREAGGDRT